MGEAEFEREFAKGRAMSLDDIEEYARSVLALMRGSRPEQAEPSAPEPPPAAVTPAPAISERSGEHRFALTVREIEVLRMETTLRQGNMTERDREQERKPRKRLPRLVRADPGSLPAFRLTRRDGEIIRSVYLYRALTTEQIQLLCFPTAPDGGVSSRCQYRLQLLFHAGYLGRLELPTPLSEGRRSFVYYLDIKGARLLAKQDHMGLGQLDWSPRRKMVNGYFLEHLLATNQVRITLVLAARAQGWQIAQWIDDRSLKSSQMKDTVILHGPQGRQQRAAVVPDGYFVLEAGNMSTISSWKWIWLRRRRKPAFGASGTGRARWPLMSSTTARASIRPATMPALSGC